MCLRSFGAALWARRVISAGSDRSAGLIPCSRKISAGLWSCRLPAPFGGKLFDLGCGIADRFARTVELMCQHPVIGGFDRAIDLARRYCEADARQRGSGSGRSWRGSVQLVAIAPGVVGIHLREIVPLQIEQHEPISVPGASNSRHLDF